MKTLSSVKRRFLNRAAYMLGRLRLETVMRRLAHDSLVIDCGANVGDITLLFARRGHRVISFEPDTKAFSVLQSRTSGFPNVRIFRQGVGVRDETARLYFHKERGQHQNGLEFSVSSSVIASKVNVDPHSFEEIEIMDLPGYIEALDERVAVLKMDIEGAEVDVLKSLLEKNLTGRIGLILVETHENRIPEQRGDVAEIREAIRRRGIRNIRLNWL